MTNALERLWREMYINHNPKVSQDRPDELIDAAVARLREMNRFIRRKHVHHCPAHPVNAVCICDDATSPVASDTEMPR